jgi:hypothetical protein
MLYHEKPHPSEKETLGRGSGGTHPIKQVNSFKFGYPPHKVSFLVPTATAIGDVIPSTFTYGFKGAVIIIHQRLASDYGRCLPKRIAAATTSPVTMSHSINDRTPYNMRLVQYVSSNQHSPTQHQNIRSSVSSKSAF